MSEEMSLDTGSEPEETEQQIEEGAEVVEQPEGEISADANPTGSEVVQENLETLKDQIQEAKDAGATKQEIKELIKEFELKVNGKTVKTKINLSDEEAVKRELQKAYAFHDVSQENAQIKNALSNKIASWKSNPAQMFVDLGLDPTDFAVNHLDRQIEESKKTPEQKEAEERERRYAEMEAKFKAMEEREARLRQLIEEKRQAEEEAREIEALTQEIDSAISKSKVLEADTETRSRLADLMAQYAQKYPDREITAELVVPILEKQILNESKKAANKLSEDELENLIGAEQLQKLIAKHLQKQAQARPAPVEKTKPTLPSQTQVSKPVQAPKKEEPKKAKSFEDVMRQR